MVLELNLIFYMWLGTLKYIYIIQRYFLILILPHAKTGLSYNIDFLHMGRHPWKQHIDSIVSISLTVWF